MKRVLIVGGAGFIGSHVNKYLHQMGYETVVFDNLSRGSKKAVVVGSFVQGDMGSPTDLDSLFLQYKFDAVMHFAAFTNVGESVTNPALYYQNNVVNTLTLLNKMCEVGVKTFIFSSSAAVYGTPNKALVQEEDSTNPINPYGRTKLMIEWILQDYARAYGLRFAALRYFNAAGGDPEGEIKQFSSSQDNLIPLVIKSLINKTSLSIYGSDYATPDGTGVRDYIHVMDLASAHLFAMEALLRGEPNLILNLGVGRGFSVLEVISAVEKVTGLKVKTVHAPRRIGDPAMLLADARGAKERLQWTVRYADLETIIAHAWKSYQMI